MSNPRIPRLEELLREELADILNSRVRDPRLELATVSRVQLSGDLRHAKVLVSTLTETTEEELLDALERANGFIRTELGSRVSLRFLPALHFQYDRNYQHASRIESLLEQLHQEERPSGEPLPDGGGDTGEPADPS